MANLMQLNPLFSRLTRFDPFRDEDWLRSLGMRPFNGELETVPQIRIDLTESDKEYTVKAEIPGVAKEDINVEVEGNRVCISAETKQEKTETKDEKVICSERSIGSSYRSFSLDSEVDDAKAEASYENGVLELKLPKKASSAAKQLKIK
ncbi:MAG: stress protein [Gallionellales bacterium RIFCSPLOWO2_12_FULL_59_22]|nr:MAG: stress protein [Gallionellales bacterium RIFCSPLOWO2_02_FULL_59_110]OGT11520.1 MAG: stress protein [Gallionellales bacterium RIFCSPLOWO2_12_FULL_59_22]